MSISRLNTQTPQRRKVLRLRRLVWGILPLVAGLWLTPAYAQDGGIVLTFGVSQRFEASDNADLSSPSSGNSLSSITRLSYGIVSETPISRLALLTSGKYRKASGPGSSSIQDGLISPSLSFTYDRAVADANLSLSGSLSEDRIADINTLNPIDPALNIGLLNATGGGKKRSHTLDAALNLRQNNPLSFGFTAGLSDTSYIGTTDPALISNHSTRAGITANLVLSSVATARFGLRYSTYKEDTAGAVQRNAKGFDAGVDFARPDGILSVNFLADRSIYGTRNRLSFTRNFILPDGSLMARIGAVRGVAGNTTLVGDLAYSYDMPLGQINASLRRDNAAGSDNIEYNITAMSLSYNRSLTPVSSLRLDINYSDREQTNIGTTTTKSGIGATYTHQLTKDWGLDLGYNHNNRRGTGTVNSTARSNTVYMELRRIFEFRP